MKSKNEILDLPSLEIELKNQYYRYQLALKDGAVNSVLSDVKLRIATLEEKIQKLKSESIAAVAYS